jgi:hypothetical protein
MKYKKWQRRFILDNFEEEFCSITHFLELFSTKKKKKKHCFKTTEENIILLELRDEF